MDFNYFQTAPQAYQFLGLPPTPGVSSEDFNNSPPVRAPSFHYVPPVSSQALPVHQGHLSHPQSEEFHQNPSPHYSHSHLSHTQPYHTSPSHSPIHQSPIQADTPHTRTYLTPRRQQDAYDQYQNFDFNPHFASANSGLPKPATPLSHHKNIAGVNANGGSAAQIHNYEVNNYEPPNNYDSTSTKYEIGNNAAAMEASNEESRRSAAAQGQSNSDDDDMTPAQSRRKAQNGAAQRAFRERKERHVKDLEAKLLAMESTSKSITAENERLKLQLQKASTENEILKATTSSSSSSPPTTAGPLRYSPTDFYSDILQSHENKTPSHRIVVSEGGERLLAAGAAWDYIIAHPLFLRGLVDVGDVSERLKRVARCDGQGPVFEERVIIKAIEMSVASGSDELL